MHAKQILKPLKKVNNQRTQDQKPSKTMVNMLGSVVALYVVLQMSKHTLPHDLLPSRQIDDII